MPTIFMFYGVLVTIFYERCKVDSRQQSTINDGFIHDPRLDFSRRVFI